MQQMNIDRDNDLSRRFKDAQVNRTLVHPKMPQPTPEHEEQYNSEEPHLQQEDEEDLLFCMQCSDDSPVNSTTELDTTLPQHSFVICADSQLGMTSLNLEWETELQYCREAVDKINTLEPRPKFVAMCGDIVDMEQSFYYNNPNTLRKFDTLKECNDIQDKQNEDFQKVFNKIHEDIAIVCLCGNHDVGNRPTPTSIERYRSAFGDEYLAFWANGSYNICLNNVLFTDPSESMDLYNEQLRWLQERLQYAQKLQATQIFVFAHHPWFLYHEEEDNEDMGNTGSAFPKEWNDGSGRFDNMIFPDAYFSIPKKRRMGVMEMFKKYNVSACFSGHFHQNLVSKASFGMDMIVTGPLSIVFESNGKPAQPDENGNGIRIVDVYPNKQKNQAGRRSLGCGTFQHRFERI